MEIATWSSRYRRKLGTPHTPIISTFVTKNGPLRKSRNSWVSKWLRAKSLVRSIGRYALKMTE
jgi:hypothetical protein